MSKATSVPTPLLLLLLLPLSLLMLLSVAGAPHAEAHQMFNSEEQRIGGYTIQVATDPEIPGPGSPSRLLVAITDREGNDLIDVRAGLKIFRNDDQIFELQQEIYRDGHIDLEYTFPESGVYIVEVSTVDSFGKEITSKFNIGIIQTFGYIFFAMVLVGASTPPTIIGVILIMRRKRARKVKS